MPYPRHSKCKHKVTIRFTILIGFFRRLNSGLNGRIMYIQTTWNTSSFILTLLQIIITIISERLNVLYERNWTMLVHEQLRRFEGSIIKATKGGIAETMGDRLPRWSFSEALLYSVTVITTIGKWNHEESPKINVLYAFFMCVWSLVECL